MGPGEPGFSLARSLFSEEKEGRRLLVRVLSNMKQAVVVNVGHGPVALRYAIDAQMLLLDRLGAHLDSIRLAVPRLLHRACASAIKEKPDILVVVGGPRSGRRAGQLAYATGTPILFLPGLRVSGWARQLWGSLSFEDMVTAIAHGDLTPVRLGVGMAENQVFFEQAGVGLLPHLPELRQALEDAETFGEGWRVIARATQLSRSLLAPHIHFDAGNSNPHRAKALIMRTPMPDLQLASSCGQPASALECSAPSSGAFGLLNALMGRGIGDQEGGWIQHFDCLTLRLEAGRPAWLLLDEDPVRFDGAVEVRFVPGAIQTFRFNPTHQHANDDPKERAKRVRPFNATVEPGWNFRPPSHVAVFESR